MPCPYHSYSSSLTNAYPNGVCSFRKYNQENTMSTSSDNQPLHQRPLEILRNLIRFDTTNPPGNESECITYVDNILAGAGFETTILAKTPSRPNLIARLKGQGIAPPLLLYGHV